MTKPKNQSGFAHIAIVTVIIAVAVVGLLGYVFWRNFMQPKNTTVKNAETSSKTEDDKPAAETDKIEYKTYTSDKYNVSFQYPSTWTLNETKGSDDDTFYQRTVEIKNAAGDYIANLVLGTQLGGTCESPANFETIEAVSTKFTSSDYNDVGNQVTNPVALSYTIVSYGGKYLVNFGLSSYYNAVKTGKTCPNTFYYAFNPSIDGINTIGFGYAVAGSKSYDSLDAAKQYAKSDEYQQIKKMLLTLSY